MVKNCTIGQDKRAVSFTSGFWWGLALTFCKLISVHLWGVLCYLSYLASWKCKATN